MQTAMNHNALIAVTSIALSCVLATAADCRAAEPSFSCRRAANSVERLICSDDALAALDRKMAEVYGAATKTPSRFTDLNAGQHSWTRARNGCWQAADLRTCIEDLYVRRIAELQAKYRLVAVKGPLRYVCNGDRAVELAATLLQTDPPSAILEYGDESTVAHLRRPGTGARYEARNVSFREQNGEVTLAWGPGAKELACTAAK
jgi:uncharacterized protein